MHKWLVGGVVAAAIAMGSTARAEHFNIKLTVTNADEQSETAFSDQSPPETGIIPRPVLKVKAGTKVKVTFMLTNVYPHGKIKNAGVRYYVVKQAKLGQKSLPETDQGSVIQGSFVLDLKPKARIGVQQTFTIDQPGAYMFRIETLRTQSNHEHFSAIDLDVE